MGRRPSIGVSGGSTGKLFGTRKWRGALLGAIGEDVGKRLDQGSRLFAAAPSQLKGQ